MKIPLDASLGSTWTAPAFDDASWARATNAIGFSSSNATVSVPSDVLADAPLAYWRFTEPGTNSGALNSGSLGSAAKGSYVAGATNTYVGLRPTNGFPGFETHQPRGAFRQRQHPGPLPKRPQPFDFFHR